jgi:hypothetical protein
MDGYRYSPRPGAVIDESAHALAVDGDPVAADNENGADAPTGPEE